MIKQSKGKFPAVHTNLALEPGDLLLLSLVAALPLLGRELLVHADHILDRLGSATTKIRLAVTDCVIVQL